MLVIVAPVTSSRLVAIGAAAWAALAASVSFGAIAFSSPPSTTLGAGPSTALSAGAGARIGVLPLDALHLVIAALAGIAVLAIGLKRDRGVAVAVAVSPLGLLLLPWLPLPVPAAFLVWTGALASLVWIAIALALARVALQGRSIDAPWNRPALAGILSLIIFSLAAWRASPSVPAGDEPHYLVITQSLLDDGDLKIENNYRRGDYQAYVGADLPPHVGRNGRNGQLYSLHAPGLPAMILPAFALGGYHGVVVFLLLVASSACALAWWLAWRTTGSVSAAWFGWAAVTVSAPFLLESYTVFPDGPGAAIVLTGFWALLREGAEGGPSVPSSGKAWVPWLFHGAALATLPWLHTRFAVIAAALGGLILLRIARTPNPLPRAIAFLIVPAVAALAWLGFFLVVYGTPDATAPYNGEVGSSLAFLPNGFGGLIFDQGFGLLPTAPVLAVGFMGFARTRRLAVEWLVVAILYLLAVGTFAMWWAGWSGPARFLVPLLLPLAVPAASAWASAKSRGARVVMLSALLLSAWLSAVMAGGGDGRLGYHTRNELGMTSAPWMEWANYIVDLPAAFPAFVPMPIQPDPGGLVSRKNATRAGFAATLPWIICLGAAVLAIVRINRLGRPPEAVVAGATLTWACAAMIAMSIVWKMHAADPLTLVIAQMDVLRRFATGREAAVDLRSMRTLPPAAVWGMRIRIPIRMGGRPRGLNRPLAVFQLIPAGSYVLSAQRYGAGDGWVMVGVGHDQFAIATRPIADFATGVRIDLPAGARTLIVRADEGARAQLGGVELHPVALDPLPPATPAPRRAVRYDGTVVFFLDERAFPEPSGFWVGGARETGVMVSPDRRSGPVPLLLRNGPAVNTVTLECAGRREDLVLKAGEERRVDVPLEPARGAALVRIRSASGFRPSQIDSNSRDSRFLGVYVRF